MTRFAWLQARTQSTTGAALLAACALAALITGPHLAHLYTQDVAACGGDPGCHPSFADLAGKDQLLQHLMDQLLRVVPALVGVFWGAPLVAREYETGTYRLAWTQGVPRSRWLLTRLAVGVSVATAIAGLLCLTVTWWFRTFDLASGNHGTMFSLFDQRSIVAVGYTVFAFLLGALLGAAIRRVIPAMAATLAAFVIVRVAVAEWVRPHFLTPLHTTTALTNATRFGFDVKGSVIQFVAGGADLGRNWTLSSTVVDTAGHPATDAARTQFVAAHCPTLAAPAPVGSTGKDGMLANFDACQHAAAQTFHLAVTYQPISRYWTFQWMELTLFVLLGLLCAAATAWIVVPRRR